MKIVEINMCSYGSTGNIMFYIADMVRKNGGEAITFSTYKFSIKKYQEKKIKGHIYYGNRIESNFHYLAGRLLARNGFFSRRATKQLVNKISEFNPDIIHIHNLHSFCVNLPILFNYLKDKNVVWTLHDCWAFTGHCAHFTSVKCDNWKNGCNKCNYYKNYPKVSFDRAGKNYLIKKKLFTSLEKMLIVTPSKWLANLVEMSFLNKYVIKVINNGIDLEVFKPTTLKKQVWIDDFADKHIVLGVSFSWGYSKGVDIFHELSNILPDNYLIVLVGANKEELNNKKIYTISRTYDKEELAEIYTRADVFVNPTREDTFPTVNIEALACGTPVITFNSCGSPEIIDKTCGIVLKERNVDELYNNVIEICENKIFSKEDCMIRAKAYDKEDCFKKYINLFDEIIKEKQ